MHWSDVCREKNGGMKCDSAAACARCIEEAARRLTDHIIAQARKQSR